MSLFQRLMDGISDAASNLVGRVRSGQNMKILLVGLDAAGKRTVLFKLKLGPIVTSTPTIGFEGQVVRHKNIHFTVFDVGDHDRDALKDSKRGYFHGTTAVVFVVDSNDRGRVDEARSALRWLLDEDELGGAALLMFANKQDMPEAMSADEVARRLGLNDLQRQTWRSQPCCAVRGEGLYEGFEWLSGQLQEVGRS